MSRIYAPWNRVNVGSVDHNRIVNRRANRFKLVIIVAALVALNGVYLWTYKGYLSGFTFVRLGELSVYMESPVPLHQASSSFPFLAYFMGAIQSTLGGNVVDVVFWPLLPVLSPLFVYPLARLFFEDSMLSVLTSFLVFLLVFADLFHFRSYSLAKLFFLMFVFATALFLNDTERYRFRFGLLSIMFFLGVKFFGPPMEAWAVTWVGVLLSLLLARRWFDESLSLSRLTVTRLGVLWIAFIVILFTYNVKFYDQFLVNFPISEQTVGASINRVAALFGGAGEQASQFAAVPQSPRVLQFNTLLQYLLIFVAVALVPLSRLIRYGPSFVYRNGRELLAVSLLAVYLQDFVLYTLVGAGVQVRYVVLVFPIVALYYYAGLSRRKILPVVLAVLILSASFGLAYEYTAQNQREYVGHERAEGLVEWQYEHTTEHPIYDYNAEMTTDLHTFGMIVAHSSIRYRDAYFMSLNPVDDELYRALTNGDANDEFAFDYYVLNTHTLEHPLQQGPPSWAFFEPMDSHVPALENERTLQKVYESDSFAVYSTADRGVGDDPLESEVAPSPTVRPDGAAASP